MTALSMSRTEIDRVQVLKKKRRNCWPQDATISILVKET